MSTAPSRQDRRWGCRVPPRSTRSSADISPKLEPGIDQTRTVGLVTLPGAFVGVLLGGGTPIQAGAAQLLVVVGLLAIQTITVVVFARLVRSGRLLSPGLKDTLPI